MFITSLVNQTTPSAALDVLRVLVMQYIQRCGGSGLVHETSSSLTSIFSIANFEFTHYIPTSDFEFSYFYRRSIDIIDKRLIARV